MALKSTSVVPISLANKYFPSTKMFFSSDLFPYTTLSHQVMKVERILSLHNKYHLVFFEECLLFMRTLNSIGNDEYHRPPPHPLLFSSTNTYAPFCQSHKFHVKIDSRKCPWLSLVRCQQKFLSICIINGWFFNQDEKIEKNFLIICQNGDEQLVGTVRELTASPALVANWFMYDEIKQKITINNKR